MKERSLFASLLLTQGLIVVALVLVLGALFYLERNLMLARLVADNWAPELRSAAGLAAVPGSVPGVRQSTVRPPGVITVPDLVPRFAALRAALEADGLPIRSLAVETGDERSTVWVAVTEPGGATRWLGFDDRRLIDREAARRLALAVPGALLLVALTSWLFARRLTRPLARLRQRMQAHQPGRPVVDDGPWAAGASAEVVAIDAAWRALRERQARHERERALMLAGVSHDLRSPLARIRMAAALLPDEPPFAARRESIVRNVHVADRLIDGFLDHARLGTLALDQPVDLASIARRAVEDAQASGLQLDAPATLQLERAHPLLVERLMANLIDNAFKHGRPPVVLRLAAERGWARVEVEDAGPGIAPAARGSLLEAFARGDASRGTPGVGLGLTIVAEGVERLGGRIEFEQPARGGFVVRLLLPMADG